jgi:hypothetical protein
MRQIAMKLLALSVAVAFISIRSSADEPKGETNKLVGT